ncbi:MAG TPA: YbjN domain-containing protein [Sedimentisphaerales bacterium]
MKHLSLAAVLAIALLTAVPAVASPLTEQGVTRELMVEIMTRHGLPARIDKDSKGNVIVKSRVADVNFDVYFFDCTDDGCREIQFAAGWTNSTASQAKINEWNTNKRYLRVYSKPGKVIWAEQDVIVGRGTTENIDEYLTTWATVIAIFKTFMNL